MACGMCLLASARVCWRLLVSARASTRTATRRAARMATAAHAAAHVPRRHGPQGLPVPFRAQSRTRSTRRLPHWRFHGGAPHEIRFRNGTRSAPAARTIRTLATEAVPISAIDTSPSKQTRPRQTSPYTHTLREIAHAHDISCADHSAGRRLHPS